MSREEVEKNRKIRIVATSCREILDEYLTAHQLLEHRVEGRLVLVN